jgi:hypothetical protein
MCELQSPKQSFTPACLLSGRRVGKFRTYCISQVTCLPRCEDRRGRHIEGQNPWRTWRTWRTREEITREGKKMGCYEDRQHKGGKIKVPRAKVNSSLELELEPGGLARRCFVLIEVQGGRVLACDWTARAQASQRGSKLGLIRSHSPLARMRRSRLWRTLRKSTCGCRQPMAERLGFLGA